MKLLTPTTLLLLIASSCDGRQFGTGLGRGLTAPPRGGGARMQPHMDMKLAEVNGGADAEEAEFSIASFIKGRLSASDASSKLIEKLKSSERLPYLISFLICCVYSYYFFFQEVPRCETYQDGFCITNMSFIKPPESYYGRPAKSCPSTEIKGNSHLWAFQADVIFTIISLILPFTKWSSDNLNMATKLSTPLIIIGHGILHKWLSSKNCYVPESSEDLIEKATQFYEIFVYALTGMMFFLFSDLPQKRDLIWVLAEVILISYGIVKVSLKKVETGNSISTLFLASQLLVSFIGAIHPGPTSTKIVGQTFIFPCLVSLLEFLNCDFLAGIGGHMWYDIFLHISVVATLLPEGADLWNILS